VTGPDSSRDFGGPNPIGGQSGAGDRSPTPAPAGPPPLQQPQQWDRPGPLYPPPSAGTFGNQPPDPGQPYGPPIYGPGQLPPAPRKKRTRLIVAIGAAVVVVIVVVAAVLVYTGGESDDGAKTAGAAVQGYLEALARGDAEAALSYARDTPPDKTFLTDAILKKQIEKYPITNIKILGDQGSQVHVVAEFGGKPSDEEIVLPEPAEGEGWKLDYAAMTVDIGKDDANNAANPALMEWVTLFGEPFPESGKAYVFPGWVDMGSSNPNLQVKEIKDEPPSLHDIAFPDRVAWPDFEVSEAGQQTIRETVKKMLDECAKSRQTLPRDCPQSAASRWDLVDGTVVWKAPDNLDAVSAQILNPVSGIAMLDGEVTFTLTGQTRDGGTTTGSDTVYLYGKIDMTQNPPKVEIR
jgi:hypothetical protein